MWGRLVERLIIALKSLTVIGTAAAVLAAAILISPVFGLVAAAIIGALGTMTLSRPFAIIARAADKFWLTRDASIGILLVVAMAVGYSVPLLIEQHRAEQAALLAGKEARLQTLRRTDPHQYLAELKAENDSRWENEFKALDQPGYNAYLADLKAKQDQERQASIQRLKGRLASAKSDDLEELYSIYSALLQNDPSNEEYATKRAAVEKAKQDQERQASIQRLKGQLASAKPDDLEELYSLYSALLENDPSNKEYANKRAAIEPALLKARRAKFDAEDQLRNPQDYVTIENFTWELNGFGTVMLANFTLKNGVPYAVKDITVTCILRAPSGTEVDQTSQVLYQRVEAKRSKRLREVNMGFVHSQSSRASCKVASVNAD